MGQLTSYLTLSLGTSRPLSLDLGHFNDDNEWDIALVTNSTFSMMILYGRGDGSFQIQRSIFMGYDSIPCSIAVADLNHDHRSDIVVVNYGTSELVLFLSNDNDTFVVNKYSTGSNGHPTSLTIDYLDKDNYLDIAVANSATHNVGVFLGSGNGELKSIKTYSTNSNSYLQFIVAGRFSSSDKCDLAVVDSRQNYLLIFAIDNNGVLSIVTNQSTGHDSVPLSIAAADFDNDTLLDLAVVNNANNDILLLTFFTFENIAKQSSYSASSSFVQRFISVADVNNDGHLDILIENIANQNIDIFIGLDDGTFKNSEIFITSDSTDFHVTGDFNKDKKLDMALVGQFNGQIRIYLGLGDGNFQFEESYLLRLGSFPSSVAIGDFNNDDSFDIVTANSWNNNLAVFFGKGDGTFFEAQYYDFTENDHFPEFIAVADFNNDGFSDLVSVFRNSPTMTILLGSVNHTFQKPLSFNLDNYYATQILLEDFNNDTIQDIVLTIVTAATGYVFY